MAAKENLFPLKMLVISLGIALIGGLVLLASLVMNKTNATGNRCSGNAIDLAGKGEILDINTEGSNLRVLLSIADGSYALLTFDACTGQPRGDVQIHGDMEEDATGSITHKTF